MELIKAPSRQNPRGTSMFLAGSIEMGEAPPWQDQLTEALRDENVTIYNPRRDDWDNSWVSSIENPQFVEQVSWELEQLENASIVVVHFCAGLLAPISLLELGLFTSRKPEQLVVYCPDGFWRKGNVDVVCQRYGVKQVHSFEDLVLECKKQIASSTR